MRKLTRFISFAFLCAGGISALIAGLEIESAGAKAADPEENTATHHVCRPSNAAARKIGAVAFAMFRERQLLTFTAPQSWTASAELKSVEPIQDPPSMNLQFETVKGQSFTGMIAWRDDASNGPSSFAIRLGVKNERIFWAVWSCKST